MYHFTEDQITIFFKFLVCSVLTDVALHVPKLLIGITCMAFLTSECCFIL